MKGSRQAIQLPVTCRLCGAPNPVTVRLVRTDGRVREERATLQCADWAACRKRALMRKGMPV